MEKNSQQSKNMDRHLDTPSESNREKHINFMDAEEKASEGISSSNTNKERQDQWQQGLEEGKEENKNSNRSTIPLSNDETIGNP